MVPFSAEMSPRPSPLGLPPGHRDPIGAATPRCAPQPQAMGLQLLLPDNRTQGGLLCLGATTKERKSSQPQREVEKVGLAEKSPLTCHSFLPKRCRQSLLPLPVGVYMPSPASPIHSHKDPGIALGPQSPGRLTHSGLGRYKACGRCSLKYATGKSGRCQSGEDVSFP